VKRREPNNSTVLSLYLLTFFVASATARKMPLINFLPLQSQKTLTSTVLGNAYMREADVGRDVELLVYPHV